MGILLLEAKWPDHKGDFFRLRTLTDPPEGPWLW